jgi:uncharacterized protein with NAD-binding domain and iron-sulfur cluster
MSAAWHLSKQPGYEIHVYEKSWRLGGKGASVRDQYGRVLDHGLHVWLGFYDNAFRMMRDCYAEVEKKTWGPAKGRGEALSHGSIADAFLPEPHVGVADPGAGGREWVAWSSFFPPEKGLPGTPNDVDTNPFTLASYLLRCFSLVKTLTLSIIGPPAHDVPGEPRPDRRSTSDEAADLNFSPTSSQSSELLIERMARMLRGGSLTGAAVLLQAVTMLEVWLRQLNFARQVPDSVLGLMEAVAAQTRKLLRDVTDIDETIRMRTEVIDIVLTIAVGLVRDKVLFNDRGLDAINQFDYREWLENHGATRTALDSRFLTGIYDFAFAYEGGDRRKPRLAAGVAVRGALRMFFTYRGAMFWRVRSGMGDAVFAPLYKVLSNRPASGRPGKTGTSPVRFHFLHDLKTVSFGRTSEGRAYVASLAFEARGDRVALDALGSEALDDHGCWPDSARLFEQASKAGIQSMTLKPSEDYHAVILATGVEEVRRACSAAMVGSNPALPRKWSRMCLDVKTVATKAAQVWLSEDSQGLGWYRGPVLLTALGSSFDTWADMTHTLAVERDYRQGAPSPFDDARSVAYFCAVLPESKIVKLRKEARDQNLRAAVGVDLDALLDRQMRPVWPDAFKKGRTARELEVGRHVQANFEGSDRYTLSLPGSLASRISPLDRSVENMTVAGDWTACGLDAGCVESAVMSGMLAAYAISGSPHPSTIVGYDHP